MGKHLALHHFTLFELPPEQRIAYAQLCDTAHPPASPASLNGDAYMALAFDRQYAGDGVIPIAEYIAVLPEQVHWDVEVPSPGYRSAGLTPQQHALRAVTAAKTLLNPTMLNTTFINTRQRGL